MSAQATDFDVNDTGDAGDGACDATCTIRDAVGDADGDDRVLLDADTYTLGGHIEITSSEAPLSGPLQIIGAGRNATIIDADGSNGGDNHFQILENTDVRISSMSLIGGVDNSGGSIVNGGHLTLNDTFFGDNTASGSEGDGGAIYNGTNRFETTGPVLLGNGVPILTVNNSVIGQDDDENEADGGHGGAIFNEGGQVIIDNTTIDHNSASRHGGGILSRNIGQVTIRNNSRLTFNEAGEEGGAIRCKDGENGFLNISDSRITDNEANNDGGGILARTGCDLTLLRSVVHKNVSDVGSGGGLYLWAISSTITDSTVSGNLLNKGGRGGGIYHEAGGLGGDLTVIRSTIANNGHSEEFLFAAGAEPAGSIENLGAQYGGGIYNSFNGALLTMINSTVSGNVAGEGGGIFNDYGCKGTDPGHVDLTHVTIANNQVAFEDSTGAGIENDDPFLKGICEGGTSSMKSVLLANNVRAADDVKRNCGGNAPSSAGTNLEDADTCDFSSSGGDGDLINTNPVIGPLAANGGPTDTHALLAGSPAIDAANNSGCPGEDQRSVTRPQGPACDIGAYEVEVSQPAATTTPAAPAPARPARPRVRVAGVRRACVRRSFVARFTITAASGATIRSVRLTVDGRRVRTRVRSRLSVRIPVARLRAGRHRLRLVVTDSAGNRTVVNRRFTKCAAPAQRRAAPRFTG